MKELSTEKQELLVRVGYYVGQIQEVDFFIPEETGKFSIDDDSVKRVRALIRQTADIMLEIMNCYDAEAEEPDSVGGEIAVIDDESSLMEIGAKISSQMAVEEVSGLAFVSRGQLLDILSAIENATRQRSIWKVASHLDSGLRRAGRALVAVESGIRECEGLPPEYRQWQNLDDSLEVRRVYGEFRRSVLGEGDPDRAPAEGELAARLSHAAERVAVLRSRHIYPYLRIDDRLEIKYLQKRLLEWLGDDADGEVGTQLWSDLVSFARLLGQVNHRQELREHDRLAVTGLYRRFFENGEAPEALTADDLTLLEPLLGRDDDLDRVILRPGEHAGVDLRELLERLRKELGLPFDGPLHADYLHPVHG